MSDLINKWNKNKNKNQKSREGKAMQLKYWDKSNQHKEKLDKLAKYFVIGMQEKFVTDKNSGKIKTTKRTYSYSNVVRDIIQEYLSRDDIKELLEQIDKENTNE